MATVFNVKGERVFYMSSQPTNELLDVYLAGQTRPNKQYRSSHNMSPNEMFDKYQFEYVTAGVGYIETHDQVYRVGRGDFFFLNRLRPHYYYTDPEHLLEKIFITVKGRLVEHLVAAYNLNESVVVRHVDVYRPLRLILNGLDAVENSLPPELVNRTALLLHEIIQMVQAPVLGRTPPSHRITDPVSLVQILIVNNLDRRISLDEMAKYANLSKSQLIRRFHEKVGLTPAQFVIRQRISEAESLLAYTTLSIQEVADRLNFSSDKHFSQTFSRLTGWSPSQHRRTNRTTVPDRTSFKSS